MEDSENTAEQAVEKSGTKYTPGLYRKEAIEFLRHFISQKDFDTIMRSDSGRTRPYVAARIFLSPADWEKYVWIEHHGSLDGFSA